MPDNCHNCLYKDDCKKIVPIQCTDWTLATEEQRKKHAKIIKNMLSSSINIRYYDKQDEETKRKLKELERKYGL